MQKKCVNKFKLTINIYIGKRNFVVKQLQKVKILILNKKKLGSKIITDIFLNIDSKYNFGIIILLSL